MRNSPNSQDEENSIVSRGNMSSLYVYNQPVQKLVALQLQVHQIFSKWESKQDAFLVALLKNSPKYQTYFSFQRGSDTEARFFGKSEKSDQEPSQKLACFKSTVHRRIKVQPAHEYTIIPSPVYCTINNISGRNAVCKCDELYRKMRTHTCSELPRERNG